MDHINSSRHLKSFAGRNFTYISLLIVIVVGMENTDYREYEFLEWLSGDCVFRCKPCRYDMFTSEEFTEHAERDHGMAWEDYVQINPDYMRRKAMFICR